MLYWFKWAAVGSLAHWLRDTARTSVVNYRVMYMVDGIWYMVCGIYDRSFIAHRRGTKLLLLTSLDSPTDSSINKTQSAISVFLLRDREKPIHVSAQIRDEKEDEEDDDDDDWREWSS